MYDGVIDDNKTHALCRRVHELQALNAPSKAEQAKIRMIMNGGPDAVRALMGPKASTQHAPYANLLLSANDKLAQKLERPPSIKKEPPVTSDSETAAKNAERTARIVESFDAGCKLPMLLPQIARWLPGYAYVAGVVRQDMSASGDPFGRLYLRDPRETFPAEWDVGQQPRDVAFGRTITLSTLVDMYPQHREKLTGRARSASGGVLLDGGIGATPSSASWSNQSGQGIEIFEYYDADGCWWVVPDRGLLLSHVPNLMKRPQFYVMKRFAFDKLAGQYDQLLGLMAAIARMSLLLIIATEDAVMSETNVYGDTAQGDNYNFGRNQVNWLSSGTKVEKPNGHVPMEAFQFLNVFERQLRGGAAYPVADDGNSPSAWATGRGLNELSAASDLLVREYFTVIADGLQEFDAMRLEWDETYYPDMQKTMFGVRGGAPFAEKYTPRTHIKGDYLTRRVYGAMAGFDEPSKIATGLQLLQAEIIDDDTMMENVDGLENYTKIRERNRVKKAETVIYESMLAMAGQGDPKAMAAAIGMLPDGEFRKLLESVFLTEEAMAPPAEEPVMPQFEAPEDVNTAISRLSTSGTGEANVTLGSQTVTRAA